MISVIFYIYLEGELLVLDEILLFSSLGGD